MLRIVAVDHQNKLLIDPSLETLQNNAIKWYWVDFSNPSVNESELLNDFFQFHPLAVEDCLHSLQRPKLEYYEDHSFFVIHALDSETLNSNEVDIFLGENFVVSFHLEDNVEITQLFNVIQRTKNFSQIGPTEVIHKIMDKIVDTYFPILQQVEDHILAIESEFNISNQTIIQETFSVRTDLLKLRKSILPMRELFYRITESKRLPNWNGIMGIILFLELCFLSGQGRLANLLERAGSERIDTISPMAYSVVS
jgi:magnesium transporter